MFKEMLKAIVANRIWLIWLSYLFFDMVYLRIPPDVRLEVSDIFFIVVILTVKFSLPYAGLFLVGFLFLKVLRLFLFKLLVKRVELLKLWERTTLEELLSFNYVPIFVLLWFVYDQLGLGLISQELLLGVAQLLAVLLLYFTSLLFKHYLGCLTMMLWYKTSFKACAVPPIRGLVSSSVITSFGGFLLAQVFEVSVIAYGLILIPLIPPLLSMLNYIRVFVGTQRTINNMAKVIEAKVPHLKGHSDKVAELALSFGRFLGLSLRELDRLYLAAKLQNIGYVVVPEEVLMKPAKLSYEEWEYIRKHPATADRILSSLSIYDKVRGIIRAHHERWDGRGYPDRLKAFQIPFEARIISLVDAYVAMRSDRPYRKALSLENTIKEILLNRGEQFDPMVVDKFIEFLIWRGEITMDEYRKISYDVHLVRLNPSESEE